MAPVVGYWNLHGLCEPIRFLLAHVKQEYEEQLYEFGPGPDFSRSNWLDKKFTLGLEFPNLPYYVDGDLKLTQSTAILRYLADKHNLNPTTKEQKRRVFEVEYQIDDFRWALIRIAIAKPEDYVDKFVKHWLEKRHRCKYEKAKDEFVTTISGSLKLFSEFLGKEKWLAGDVLTYVDFMFYEALKWYDLLKPGCLAEFANLKDYVARFEALPNISSYMKSKFKKRPTFGPMANFGYK